MGKPATIDAMETRSQQSKPSGRAGAPGRPTLEPQDPLPGWQALLQVVILLGVPIAILLIARMILHAFFPDLGY